MGYLEVQNICHLENVNLSFVKGSYDEYQEDV